MITLNISLITAILTAIVILGKPWVICRYLLVVGVLCHEISHWLVALVLGGKPTGIDIQLTKAPVIKGTVIFYPTGANAGFIALAPLLYQILGIYLISSNAGGVQGICQGMLAGLLFLAGIPSVQDWWIAVKYPISSIVALTGVFLIILEILNLNIQT